MSWFESLTGFAETTAHQVRENLAVDGDRMTSRVNGRVLTWGALEIPSLGELRVRVGGIAHVPGTLSAREVVGDVQALHADVENAGSLFQVASQFNLLEMVSPRRTPEDGIGIYEHDRTQGPACAIAAGAGTIYRNYFVDVNGQVGQSAERQIDCLADLGSALGNVDGRLWTMQNGYALATDSGLEEISTRLRSSSDQARDALRQLLRIGIQWNTQVTLGDATHTVTQVYGSALPVAYSSHDPARWEDFARLVLEASYEATLCAAILNANGSGTRRVYLTLLGGGAFGNAAPWITAAITRALRHFERWDLDVAIVSYGAPNRSVGEIVREFRA